MNKTLFKNGNVYYQGKIRKLDILVEDEKISDIAPEITDQGTIIDIEGKLVSLGFVDLHVHLRQPGYEHKETVATGTLAALYGGYSHVVAMANTNPVMDDVETIARLEEIIEKDAMVHTYSYSAITKNLAGKELVDFKANLESKIIVGFSDDGRGVQEAKMMEVAMKEAKKYDSLIVAHCEDEEELVTGGSINLSKTSEQLELVGINNASESNQACRDLVMASEIKNRYHICHISTKETIGCLAKYHNDLISGEVCPHHLILCDEDVQKDNPNFKMNPPLRSKDDVASLIGALNSGVVTCISTDHAPHSIEEKSVAIDKAPFGIIGSQHAFCLCYTHLVKKGLVALETILDSMSANPARVLRIDHRLEIGAKANFNVIDLDKEFVITKESIKSKSINTPFLNTKVSGLVAYNIIDGKVHNLQGEK